MEGMTRILLAALAAAALAADGFAADVAEQIRHRGEIRRAIAEKATHGAALEAALGDADPAVRRYALYVKSQDLGDDAEALKALGQRFADDPAPQVRVFAKALNRKGGLFRLNEPLSLSPFNDHETIRVETAKPTDGVYRFAKPPAAQDAVELWFGKPDRDLYVWVNGTYVGQFDKDLDGGKEFRLDVTAETKKDGENTVVVRDPSGKAITQNFTAEALHW